MLIRILLIVFLVTQPLFSVEKNLITRFKDFCENKFNTQKSVIKNQTNFEAHFKLALDQTETPWLDGLTEKDRQGLVEFALFHISINNRILSLRSFHTKISRKVYLYNNGKRFKQVAALGYGGEGMVSLVIDQKGHYYTMKSYELRNDFENYLKQRKKQFSYNDSENFLEVFEKNIDKQNMNFVADYNIGVTLAAFNSASTNRMAQQFISQWLLQKIHEKIDNVRTIVRLRGERNIILDYASGELITIDPW